MVDANKTTEKNKIPCHEHVSQWLRKVPGFEVNTRTVEILYELLLIKDQEQKTEEYGSDGTHLQEVLLQAVGLQAERLSRSTVDLLSALEGTAEVLKLRDTSLGSYMPAINNLTNERKQTRGCSGNLLLDLMKITHTQQVEAATAEQRLLNMDFMKNKSRDLACRNKIAQVSISMTSYCEQDPNRSFFEPGLVL
uniref:HAUS augmin-like complex, subunit 1 n=1 Tax=Sinocyclocheilus grahami TaxID=75366 RepID=A0A672MYB4_SINGR